MKLVLTENIITRTQVQRLAEANPGVTEIDMNGKEIYGASAMDELLHRFPGAAFIGMSAYATKEMVWVLEKTGRNDIEMDTAPVAEKLRSEYEALQQHNKEDNLPPMRSYMDFLETRIEELVKIADDAMDEKDAENTRLRTALQPFAELWRHFGDDSMADFAFTVRVRHSWLKAAVDALKEIEP